VERLRGGAGRRFGAHLQRREPALLHRATSPLFPPIFVIGLPRAGSTLVYQALVRGLHFAFFHNAAALFPAAPCAISGLLARLAPWSGPPAVFTSEYGVVPGWQAPSQARKIWGRWFPMDQSYVAADHLSAASLREMRATVAFLERLARAPFVSKAQGHAVRILPLCEAFPGSVFVRVRRSHAEVAESILAGRRDCFHDDAHWFSAKPSDHRTLNSLAPCAQIAAQIHGLERDMDRDLQAAASDRIFEITYDDFCAAPRVFLVRFADFYRRCTGHSLRPRHPVPESFTVSRRTKVSAEESRQLMEELALRDPSTPRP
jgi:hypothetical protein